MPLTVLLADDDRDLAWIVAYAARQVWPGCRALIAADGGTALRHFAAEEPDVVILDVAMPPPDGFEVCRRICETSGAPILILTASEGPAGQARAFARGDGLPPQALRPRRPPGALAGPHAGAGWTRPLTARYSTGHEPLRVA